MMSNPQNTHGRAQLIDKTVLVTGANRGLDGVERGEEEIFPDPMSRSLADGWHAGVAKQLERQNAAMVQAQPIAAQPGRRTGPRRERGRGPDAIKQGRCRSPRARSVAPLTRMSSAETRSVSVELGGELLTSQLLWMGVPLAIGF
jgi:hypothetical protein